MKKVIIWISLIIGIVLVFVIATKIVDYNSLASKNSRYLEQMLSDNSVKNSIHGNVKNLLNLDYDKMYVFEPYQSLDKMEKQIGFKYSKLKEGLSEGSNNILFVKDNRVVAYLFGYSSNTGYFIKIPSGEYTKIQLDKMTYKMEKREVGNSYGTPKRYVNYEFID